MKVKRAGDLVFWTYHMVNWKEVAQSPSECRCVQCGGPMMNVEPIEDPNGMKYDGRVCHECKRVIWVKRG